VLVQNLLRLADHFARDGGLIVDAFLQHGLNQVVRSFWQPARGMILAFAKRANCFAGARFVFRAVAT
jgi:hypothetical protein